MIEFMKFLFIAFAFVLMGCGSMAKTPYRIAIDPSWYPMELMGKEANVFAFSNELLREIAAKEKIQLERINVTWDNLLEGLQKDEYDAILSPLPPYNFNLSKYDFSEIYLQTGFVLVVPERQNVSRLDDMENQEVAVQMNSEGELILNAHPEVIVRFYDSPAAALDQLAHKKYAGVVMGMIPAVSFISDLYADQLKIAGDPLNVAGLRLVSMKDKRKELMDHFNRGLERMQDDGSYNALLKKWNVGFEQ